MILTGFLMDEQSIIYYDSTVEPPSLKSNGDYGDAKTTKHKGKGKIQTNPTEQNQQNKTERQNKNKKQKEQNTKAKQK